MVRSNKLYPLVVVGWNRHHGRLEKPKPSGMECDAPTKGAEGCGNTVWEQMEELEPEEADAGPKNPGAATMLIHIQTDVRTCTVERSVDLVNVLQILIVAHQRIVVLEGSTAASVQPYTAKLPGNKFSVVMREPMKAVLKVWPEVRSTVHEDDKKFVCKQQSWRRDSNSTESV